jgi:LssY C-terminus
MTTNGGTLAAPELPMNAIDICRRGTHFALLRAAAVGIVISHALLAVAQPSTSSTSASAHEIEVASTKQWVDTGIDVRGGAKLRFTATGQITYPADSSMGGKTRTIGSFGPDGLSRGFADLLHAYAVASANHGALVGRIGSESYSPAFTIGANKEYEAPIAGRLFVGINQSAKDAAAATGNFQVKVEVLSAGSADLAGIGGPAETRIEGISQDLLSKIPRRVSDPAGNPGDMVNVLIVGTEEQVLQAFTTGGWAQVDKTVRVTAMNALVGSLEKKDYLSMPMSVLFLFNRAQDYGFAHAEPVRVAMSRNHLRVWKSPYEVNGRPLWCVAATHDIGFERDQRNNGLTHKIDPAIDGEREYVNGTLSSTGLVIQRDHVTPADPLTTAKTATGGEFHSDGRILVLVISKRAEPTKSAAE